MSRTRVLVVAAVVALFVVAGAFLALRGTGGPGRPVTLNLEVKGGTMTPADPHAGPGDTITMTVTADRREEIHLHGYDIKFEIEGPGKPVTKTFKADKTGDFPIEIEDLSREVGSLTVR